MEAETVGQGDRRDREAPQTVGTLAALAVKVGVKVGPGLEVVVAAMAVRRTGGVLHLPGAVVHAVHDVVGQEKRERPEDSGLVDGDKPRLEVGKRSGAAHLPQGAKDKDAQRGRLDARAASSCSRAAPVIGSPDGVAVIGGK